MGIVLGADAQSLQHRSVVAALLAGVTGERWRLLAAVD